MDAIQLWRLWQQLLHPLGTLFTAPGFRRFVQGLTGLVLNVEEHTVTQSLLATAQTDHWQALQAFVEYGAWDHDGLVRVVNALLQDDPGRLWYGFHVHAGDDSKVHRSSPDVWGSCTFPEYSARCPNRASTVRAHNGVVVGALLHRPEQPACFASTDGRLYFRASQLPAGETFQTKCQLLVALFRQSARQGDGFHLAVFAGALAVASVVRPLARPTEPDQPSIDFLTRLRPCSPGRNRSQRGGVRRGSGASDCHHRDRADAGPGPGSRGRRSCTVGGARCAGRNWSACGACSARRDRSRWWWRRWKAIASVSRW